MATEYELTLSDYISIVRRRAPWLIGTFVLAVLIAVKVAYSIPAEYRSTGTILVESPLVSENSAGAIKNDLDERIVIIWQRVMTRDNLLQIARQYGVFGNSDGSMTTTKLIDEMRSHIFVEPASSNASREGQPTIAFTISFEDQHPQVALQVAKELVTRFLQLNQRESMRARAESDLFGVERAIRFTNEELRALDAELSAANSRHVPLAAANQAGLATTPEGTALQALDNLKAEYAKLSAVYTESHPDVRALKRKIVALEQTVRADQGTSRSPMVNYSSAAYAIRVKVDAANAKLDSLMQQRRVLQDRIAQLDHSMGVIPNVAEGSDAPARDRSVGKAKYGESRDKKVDGQNAQSLETETKSERFSLLESPVLPEKPYKPQRLKIVALGVFFAMLFSGSVVMALETVDKRIRGIEALSHALGYRPLVAIPYLFVQEEEVRRKRIVKQALLAAFVTLIAVAIAIHFMYIRLDVLLIKTLASLA